MTKNELIFIPYAINFSELSEKEYAGIASEPTNDNAEEMLYSLLNKCENDKQRFVIITEFLISNGFNIVRNNFVRCFDMSVRDYYTHKKKFAIKNKDIENDV